MENQIFADHEAVWNKVFGMMSKSDADPSKNYADYLADTVEANKDSFTEDELKTLTDDIDPNRNSTPIILNRYRAVFVQCYDDRITESSQRFIYGIIYNFVYQMMKSFF